MSDYYEHALNLVRAQMIDGQPLTPRELITHDIASRLAGIQSELDDLISLSREFDAPDLQAAIQAEELSFSQILCRVQLICSFIEASKPRGLRLVGGRVRS